MNEIISQNESVSSLLVQYHLESLAAIIRQWKQNQKFPPVILLNGQAGIGKKEIVRYLTQWLLCSTPEENSGPCQKCPACIRFRSGTEVNVIEMSSDSETLKIESFRRLKSTVGFGAHQGNFKIIWILGAERMTPQAANSILKLLEEPPQGWIFFLTSNDPTLLLPTLVSRCQMIRLKPLSLPIIRDLLGLAQVDPRKKEICAQLSQGSWERAFLFSKDEIWKQRLAVFEFLKNPAKELQALMDWASQETLHFELLVDLLEQFAADLLRWSACQPSCPPETYAWQNKDDQNSLAQHASALSKKHRSIAAARDFWLARSEQLAQVRAEFNLPLNRKLLLQNTLLPWLEGCYI
jgi:DNA polymerase III delta prime subunit